MLGCAALTATAAGVPLMPGLKVGEGLLGKAALLVALTYLGRRVGGRDWHEFVSGTEEAGYRLTCQFGA